MGVTLGIPVRLLHEAVGLVVTVEVDTFQTYRGVLLAVEDNMNIQLQDVVVTHRDGHLTKASQVFLRGSHVRWVIVPDNLKHAPMFSATTKKAPRVLQKGKRPAVPTRR